MKDADIREALYAALRERREREPDIRVISEMGLWNGSVRVDVAVLGGELEGFEIKSDSDTLSRLPAQADIYGMVFDRMTLVCGSKHTEKARAAIPGWWGLTEATFEGGILRLAPLREAAFNPGLVAVRVAGLLWKSEAIAALAALGVTRGVGSMRLGKLHEAVAGALSQDETRRAARMALAARTDWLARHDPLFVGPRAKDTSRQA